MNGTAVQMLPIAKIAPDPDNERGDVGDVTELAASIKEVGLLEAITVRPEGKGYLVVFGHRRLAGVKLAGLQLVPAIVRDDLTAEQRTIARLVENLHRQDLTPLQEAAGFQKLLEHGLSQHQVADRVGRSQAHVSKRLTMLRLPEVAKAAVVSGGISNEDALELAKLVEHPDRLEDALGSARHGVGMLARRVQEHLTELAAREAQHATRALLDAEGLKVLGHAESRWDNAYRLGKQHMADCPADAPTTDEIVAAKKKLGAFINWDGSVTYVSTEPVKNSVRKETAEQKAWREERDRKDRERAEKRAQVAARREALKSLLVGKLAAVHRDHVLRMAPYMSDTEREEYQVAELLGIELPDDQHEIAELQAIFAEWVGGSVDRAVRFAYACALIDGEESVWLGPVARRIHEEHLAVIGLAGPAEEGAGEPAPSDDSREAASSPASTNTTNGETANRQGDETAAERAELERRAKIDEARRQLEEAEIVTPAPRDPKACRICGCHGDCEGGCTWVEVDPVAGLLCDSHPAPVPA